MAKSSLQPEFFCGWKMLVVVDPVAYLASIYGKRGGAWLTYQTLVGHEKHTYSVYQVTPVSFSE